MFSKWFGDRAGGGGCCVELEKMEKRKLKYSNIAGYAVAELD